MKKTVAAALIGLATIGWSASALANPEEHPVEHPKPDQGDHHEDGDHHDDGKHHEGGEHHEDKDHPKG